MKAYQKKKVLILGATGSIGESTLAVIRNYPNLFEVVGITYHANTKKALEIIREFSIKNLCITDSKQKIHISENVRIYNTINDILEIEFDCVVVGIVGSAGLLPVLSCIELEKTILLANKESLVMGGSIINDKLQQYKKAKILPLDSEHNSLYRLISSQENFDIHKVILTASGGPLLQCSTEEIKQACLQDVLKHPTWNMGKKITVDSAGLVNKALEIIEAHFLFSVPYTQLDAIIHPNSFFHAIIEHKDGTYSMHASQPDMIYPIAYCLFYPQPPLRQIQKKPLEEIAKIGLSFHTISKEKFPGFFLGIESGRKGGCYSNIFYSSNETAVELFLEEKIKFYQIPLLIEYTLDKAHNFSESPSIEEILHTSKWAKKITLEGLQNAK